MGILNNVLGVPEKPDLGSTSPIKGGILAPFRAAQTVASMFYAIIPVSILWGMTFKPPDDQSWGIGDYIGVLVTSYGIAHIGGGL